MSEPRLDVRNATYSRGDTVEWQINHQGEWHEATFLSEDGGWCHLKDEYGHRLVHIMSVRKKEFKPGLFRLNDGVSSAAAGQQIRWFDVAPSENWVRVT